MEQADPADSPIEPFPTATASTTTSSLMDVPQQEEQQKQQQQQQQQQGDGTNTNAISTTNLKDDISKLPKEIRNLVAGGMAGMVAKSFVAPFDRIKILYQISSAKFHVYDIPKVVQKIVETEGFPALWKGNLATMIRVFPYSGIQFMVFDRCKLWLLQEHQKQHHHEQQQLKLQQHRTNKHQNTNSSKRKWGLSATESLMAGMTAGGVSVISTYPLDLTRAQLAVLRRKQHGERSVGFYRVLTDNYNHRGFFGLFRGITPTLMGILPYSGIAFALNEQAKRKIQNMTGREVTTLERLQCGALSGLFAQTVAYPLEVTRRRMQTIGIVPTSGRDAAVSVLDICETNSTTGTSATTTTTTTSSSRMIPPPSSHHHPPPPSMTAIVRDLYVEQGMSGFFKGVSVNWFKGPIAFSISFTAFDLFQKFVETEAERNFRIPRRWTQRHPSPGVAAEKEDAHHRR